MKRQHLILFAFIMSTVFIIEALSLIRADEETRKNITNMPKTDLSSAFTYQGQLKDNGLPASGNYDFKFTLYNVLTEGSPLSSTLSLPDVPVSDGIFTVQLDFGDVFNNQQLFLEIAVRPSGVGEYTTLIPRQAITPVPQARYSVKATNAQSVPWSGVSDKPAELFKRSIYVPANAMNYTTGSDLSLTQNGIRWTNTDQIGGFGVPQPKDWDKSTPFTVTLYFALYQTTSAGFVSWRLRTGTSNLNLSVDYPDSGWDQITYSAEQDANLLGYGHASGRSYLMKEQSWESKWSSTYNTWYFGSGVNTNNDFSDDPMWYFYFQRGAAVSNGETYTGNMYVVAAEITYTAIQ